MLGYEGFCCGFGWWWIFPVVMIVMFTLCFFMMRGRTRFTMCGPFSRASGDAFWKAPPESAIDILDKRYARGEIGKEEYQEKKKDMDRTEG
jgi:putative membrane protein